MKLLFTAKEDDFDAINAVMVPDVQMKDCEEGDRIKIAKVFQTTVINTQGEEKISTTIVTPEGTSYQTLSDFVDRLVRAADQKWPAEQWEEHPITIEVHWKKSRNGRNMLAPKLIAI